MVTSVGPWATVDEHGVEFKCRKAVPGAAWGGAAQRIYDGCIGDVLWVY
jgi:hypothetical protein